VELRWQRLQVPGGELVECRHDEFNAEWIAEFHDADLVFEEQAQVRALAVPANSVGGQACVLSRRGS
jgi:hypothetical protein